MEEFLRKKRKKGEGQEGGSPLLFLLYLSATLGFLLFYPISGNWERLLETKNLLALLEIALVSIALWLGSIAVRRAVLSIQKLRRGVFLLILLELYLHRMLLPFFLSGIYFALTSGIFLWIFGEGKWIARGVRGFAFRSFAGRKKKDRKDNKINKIGIEEGEGSRSFVGEKLPQNGVGLEDFDTNIASSSGRWEQPELLLLPAIPFLLIQLNRMNIGADYDSLRYGLRSPYVLFNEGFFSSHGQINAVYSYPKGLELLLTPLSSFHSFALNFMFQFWTLLSIAFLIYLFVKKLSGSRRQGIMSINLLFMISAFTNMSVSSKTDLLTLLMQLLLLWYAMRGERGKAFAAGIFSYSLKPTAVVFTTLLLGVMILVSLYQLLEERGRIGKAVSKTEEFSEGIGGISGEKNFRKKDIEKRDIESREAHGVQANHRVEANIEIISRGLSFRREMWEALPALLFCTLYTAVITARTLWITGVPVSTTYTAIFESLGFHVNWPFNLDSPISYSGEASLMASIFSLGRRLLLLLFCPVGADMEHVAIAWGGVWIPILLYFAGRSLKKNLPLCFAKSGGSLQRRVALQTLYVSFLVIAAFSILTLAMLWQVDGNYYILFYSLLLIVAFSERQKDKRAEVGEVLEGFLPISLSLMALFTSLITSWAGAVGFTPIDLVNKGYYDNLEEIRAEERLKGSYPLWEELARDKKNRVLSFSETPDAYKIPCNVQSITDVEGSGGSPGVYDERKLFEWFLGWAESDYVYLERGFLKKPESVRNREILPALIEDGMLKEAKRSGDYLLFEVDKERLRYVWDEIALPPEKEGIVSENLRIYESWLQEKDKG